MVLGKIYDLIFSYLRKFIFFQVTFRYHIQIIKEWRSINQLIRVINKNDNNLLSRSNIEQQYSLLYTLNRNHSHILTSQNEEI
jgi:hypothetical protein